MLVVLGQRVKEMLVVREVLAPIILAAVAAVPVVGVLLQVVLPLVMEVQEVYVLLMV
jgi:hypothetical protein